MAALSVKNRPSSPLGNRRKNRPLSPLVNNRRKNRPLSSLELKIRKPIAQKTGRLCSYDQIVIRATHIYSPSSENRAPGNRPSATYPIRPSLEIRSTISPKKRPSSEDRSIQPPLLELRLSNRPSSIDRPIQVIRILESKEPRVKLSQYYFYCTTLNTLLQDLISSTMSNPGYFTQAGLQNKEADSNNNCQPDPGAKRARMEDRQTGTGQADHSQTSTSHSSYETAPAGSSSSDSSPSDSTPSDVFSSSSSDISMEADPVVTTIQWYTPWHVDPWNWRPAISPRIGTNPHPADPRGQPPLPLHQRLDPRHRQLRKIPIEIPFFRLDGSDKRIQDPRQLALIPQASPSMERMHRGQQLHHRMACRTAPLSGQDLLSGLMNSMERLHCSTSPIYSKTARTPLALRVTIDPIPPPIPESPRSPVKPKGSRNIPMGGKLIIKATNDPLSTRPRPPNKFSAPTPDRKVYKIATGTQAANTSQQMDALIASQIVKIGKERSKQAGRIKKKKDRKTVMVNKPKALAMRLASTPQG